MRGGATVEEPFLDVRDRLSSGGERGLLSLTFSPDYADNGRFYLYYTDEGGDGVISSFFVSRTDPDLADPDSEEVRLRVVQPRSNHNGGRLVFGPDGYLYFGFGDGGGGGDPDEAGQDGGTLLGSIIRIDVESVATDYVVPGDNPFVNDDRVRDEIWALGVRNPWRISIDAATGDLFVADVGQNSVEEISVIQAGDGGRNLGWNLLEGDQCFTPNCREPANYLGPVFTYDHSAGACSVTGGEVYRGQLYPELEATYLFGDFCNGRIYGANRTGSSFAAEVLLNTNFSISTFGRDEIGNVYIADADSGIYLLSDGPAVAGGRPMSGTMSGTYRVSGLSDQGFFVNVGERDDGSEFLFFAWFTFEAGEPLWLIGTADIPAGASTITFDAVQRLSGLNFLDFSDANAEREVVGSMTLTASTCDLITADYDLPGLGGVAGSLELARLTNTAGHRCDE